MFYLFCTVVQIALGVIFIHAVRDYKNITTTTAENVLAIIIWPYAIVGQLVYKFFYWSISNNG